MENVKGKIVKGKIVKGKIVKGKIVKGNNQYACHFFRTIFT